MICALLYDCKIYFRTPESGVIKNRRGITDRLLMNTFFDFFKKRKTLFLNSFYLMFKKHEECKSGLYPNGCNLQAKAMVID